MENKNKNGTDKSSYQSQVYQEYFVHHYLNVLFLINQRFVGELNDNNLCHFSFVRHDNMQFHVQAK